MPWIILVEESLARVIVPVVIKPALVSRQSEVRRIDVLGDVAIQKHHVAVCLVLPQVLKIRVIKQNRLGRVRHLGDLLADGVAGAIMRRPRGAAQVELAQVGTRPALLLLEVIPVVGDVRRRRLLGVRIDRTNVNLPVPVQIGQDLNRPRISHLRVPVLGQRPIAVVPLVQRQPPVGTLGVHQVRGCQLAEVVLTLDVTRRLARARQHRQQDADQRRDDADHHQRKTVCLPPSDRVRVHR